MPYDDDPLEEQACCSDCNSDGEQNCNSDGEQNCNSDEEQNCNSDEERNCNSDEERVYNPDGERNGEEPDDNPDGEQPCNPDGKQTYNPCDEEQHAHGALDDVWLWHCKRDKSGDRICGGWDGCASLEDDGDAQADDAAGAVAQT